MGEQMWRTINVREGGADVVLGGMPIPLITHPHELRPMFTTRVLSRMRIENNRPPTRVSPVPLLPLSLHTSSLSLGFPRAQGRPRRRVQGRRHPLSSKQQRAWGADGRADNISAGGRGSPVPER